MSLAAKIVITIAVCFVLVAAGAVGLGIILWKRHSGDLIEAGRKQYDQGVALGRLTDESGCLDEAVTRYKGNRGMTGSLAAGVFVRSCWMASRPTAGFCDHVPKPLDLFNAARWQVEQSKRAGIDEQFGGQIFAQQRAYCDVRKAPASDAVTPR
jgi:hypothetical protein